MWIQVRTMDGRKSARVDSLSKLTTIEQLRERRAGAACRDPASREDSSMVVWYPDPSVQAHARTRITACACGKEGLGKWYTLARALECETAHKMSCYEYA